MSGWKDTVMSDEQIAEVAYMAIEAPDRGTSEGWKQAEKRRAIAKAQAEISFKAGYFEGRGLGIRDGIGEVVECLINDFYFSPVEGSEYYRMWRAKLKEWGIK